MVYPVPLKEALRDLKLRGEVASYQIGRYNTVICLTRHSGLAMMIKEASLPVANPRPHTKNKHNGKKFRKA